MKMWSQRRIAPVALASLTLATGCYNPDSWIPLDSDGSATAADVTDTDPSAGTSPFSTVTSDTGGSTGSDPSTGSGTAGTSEGSDATGSDTEATGDRVDEAPTIELLVDESASVPTVVQATTLTLSAHVADDHKVVKVEFFVDGMLHADVAVDGDEETTTVSVPLAIYDDSFNKPSPHSVYAVVHDDAEQATSSETINFKVELPVGGSKVWEATSDNPFPSKAYGVTTDSQGDVIVVGSQAVSPDPTRTRILIRKYDRDNGALIWEKLWPPPGVVPNEEITSNNVARGVAVDDEDDIYVVGSLKDQKSLSLWLGKYTHDGVKATVEHTGDEPGSVGHGVVVSEGRVFVAGYYRKADLAPQGILRALDTTTLDPMWTATDLSQIGSYGNNLYGIALDNSGNVVVVGALRETLDESRGLIAVYAPTGKQAWYRGSNTITKPEEWAYNVAVTPENEFVCVGRKLVNKDTRRLWSWRVSSKGNEQVASVDVDVRCGGPEVDSDEFCGVAVAPSGHEILSGVDQNGLNDDFMVKKMTPKSQEKVWIATLDGYDAGTDRSVAVTTDADGFVIAVGYEHVDGTPTLWAAKYNP